MPNSTTTPVARATHLSSPNTADLEAIDTLELVQALSERLTITDTDWHRLKSNRRARASEQVAVALTFLLRNQPEAALERLQQACGWLDGSIAAPACPDHHRKKATSEKAGE